MDCPHKIPSSGTLVTHHKCHRSHNARSSLRQDHVKTETGKANPDHSLIFEGIAAQAIMICIEAALDHNTEIDVAITEAVHNNLAPTIKDTATDLTMTPLINHIIDHPNTEALQATDPNIIVDHTHNHPIGLQGMNHMSIKLTIQHDDKVKTTPQK